MKQSFKHANWESGLNIAIGISVAYFFTQIVGVHAFNIGITWTQNLVFTGLMTAVSHIRQVGLNRIWECICPTSDQKAKHFHAIAFTDTTIGTILGIVLLQTIGVHWIGIEVTLTNNILYSLTLNYVVSYIRRYYCRKLFTWIHKRQEEV